MILAIVWISTIDDVEFRDVLGSQRIAEAGSDRVQQPDQLEDGGDNDATDDR